jgi:hypothetical protein
VADTERRTRLAHCVHFAAAMDQRTKTRLRHHPKRNVLLRRSALFFVAPLAGCGGVVGAGPSQPPPPGVAVTVTPATAAVLLGLPQRFAATVAGASNTGVSWSVNGIPSGNSTIGTIDASGLYTAPADLPVPASVTVQAVSEVDPSETTHAAVEIASDVSVSVSPQSSPVELGASRSFTATVSSAGQPNRAVTWVVSGSACGTAACGIVDRAGNYTAPQVLTAPPNVTLTAISVADPSKSASGTITITSSFSLSVRGPTTVNAGSTATFTATLTPAPGSNPSRVISWSVAGAGCSGSGCGSISSAGVYTAPAIPPSSSTVQIAATPQADPSKAVSISTIIIPSITVTVTPTAATVPLGGTQAFQAAVTGVPDANVTWSVNSVVGGNSNVGTILNSQTSPNDTTYTAPPSLPLGGPVTVTATSNANPTISASAQVTFNAAIGVSVSPSTATVAIGHRQTLTLQVSNTPNQVVNWAVNGALGGNSTTGQICATGSNPCQPVSMSGAASIDYLAPAGIPSPNPVYVMATSQADPTKSASVSITIIPHVAVSVLPGSVTIAGGGQQRFAATVLGTNDQQVLWSVSGTGCGAAGACGSIDSTGFYTAPPAAPAPNLIQVVATSAEDATQSGAALVTIFGGPSVSSLAPASAYAGATGGFTLVITGENFAPSTPGPGSIVLAAGLPMLTTCGSVTQCSTSLSASQLQSAGDLSVQVQNPDGSLSNSAAFVILAEPTSAVPIPLTPGAPTSMGNNIVVVDLSTNGGSGAPGNVSLNIAAMGAYSVATASCTLGGSPVVITRPASGTGTADLCVFSISGLDPSFSYTVSGPAAPDLVVSGREPLGLGIVHLTVQVPSTAAPGPRTLFVQNPEKDQAAGTGAIEVR